MTNPQGDRIDRIEALLFQVAQQQGVNTAALAENAEAIRVLRAISSENTSAISELCIASVEDGEAITELRIVAEALLQTSNQYQENFRVLVQEIRELRVDYRRLTNHWIGEYSQ